MSNKGTVVNELNLSGTKNGKISISTIDEPYGKNSQSVVSIAISLQANIDDADWKIHIPKDNIDEVIEALKSAKNIL